MYFLANCLDSVSNLGGTFPKYFVLKLVDGLHKATCIPPSMAPGGVRSPITAPFSCALEAEKNRCTAGGGVCRVDRDGFYYTNILCVAIGALTFWFFIREAVMKLQRLPLRAWRVAPEGGSR